MIVIHDESTLNAPLEEEETAKDKKNGKKAVEDEKVHTEESV